ncbi:S-layer homology domain-containing protein [Paenibacillus sp.]|uniref:S-layer homology domain-containing protein n=1 Tax=Paenibacillus sp. TaxID=58172 RepID=UPI002D43CC64|nr:lamin tail domain-containing protein [Paenibacillus sp.]HZG83417.1 lamin tail domain-containing protein [Paenibacillus sp.]
MKKWLAGLLSLTMVLSLLGTSGLFVPKVLADGSSPLVISEVYPDDRSNSGTIEGAGSNDLFEFIEIYNRSHDAINFNESYKIRYDYKTNIKDLSVTDTVYADAPVVIPAHSPAVLWVERTNASITGEAKLLDEADFRAYHGVPDNVPVFKLKGQDGLANADRGFYLTDKSDHNTVYSHVHYTSDDVGDGKSLHLKMPTDGRATMAAYAQKAEPTAGRVDAEQWAEPAGNQAPSIAHVPATAAPAGAALTIEATVTEADSDALAVKLFYRTVPSEPYVEAAMTADEEAGRYTYQIPAESVTGDRIYYYIEASDGERTTRSVDYETELVNGSAPAEAPSVLITEIVPNPAGDFRKGSGNQYEYVEIYNNSNKTLDLQGYTLWYLYPSGNPKKWVIPVNTNIEPYTTAVIWFAKEAIADGYATAGDFNLHYHSSLAAEDIIVYDNSASTEFNLPNSLHRGVGLSTSSNPDEIIAEAWYDASSAGSPDRMVSEVRNSAIRYSYPLSGTEMRRMDVRTYANPGSIDPGQVPAVEGVDMLAPTLQHDAVTGAAVNHPVTFTVSSDEPLDTVTMRYGPAAEPTNASLVFGASLTLKSSDSGTYVYEGTFPFDAAGTYRYVIEGADAAGNRTSIPYNSRGYVIEVSQTPQEGGVPRILITELVPNPAGDFRYGSGNQYEYLELYNNSSETLDLQGYTLWYLYPDSANTKKWVIPESTAIEPYSTAVIWFAKEAISNGSGYTTTADFNLHYNSTLTDEDIIFYDNSASSDFNLPNSLHRGFAISSAANPEKRIVEAWYDASSATSPEGLVSNYRNSAVRYAYPTEGNGMQRLGVRLYANPGSIDPDQVPPVEGVDMVAPTIRHEQSAYQAAAGKPFAITLKSDEPLASATVLYGADTETGIVEYTESAPLTLVASEAGSYTYESSVVFSANGAYRYVIEAVDGSGNRTRVPYNSRGALVTVNETGYEPELPPTGLSVASGEMMKGVKSFFAHAQSADEAVEVYFENDALQLRPALPGTVRFNLQTRGIDQIYQSMFAAQSPSGVKTFLDRLLPKYQSNAWSEYDIPADYFVAGTTISIHAGNENAPYIVSKHDQYFGNNNHDDFEVKNLHLILADGTTVKPDQINNHLGNMTQTTVVYREDTYFSFGDANYGSNSNKPLISEFHFPIPQEKFTSRYAEIDTKAYADGVYTVTMRVGDETIDTKQVTIDNTSPVIQGIRSGEGKWVDPSVPLKGEITLEAEATDNLTGIARTESTLDGKAIELPYKTSSTKLTPGAHVLKVTVYDGAGNSTALERTFSVVDEKPLPPSDIVPQDKSTGIGRNLTIGATLRDPTGDAMNVVFHKGDTFDYARKEGGVTGYVYAADREPPLTVSLDGEAAMGEAEQTLLSEIDGKYLTTDTEIGFPYHRFEVEVGHSFAEGDAIELHWSGRTLPGRIVTLYAWDHTVSKWTALSSATGDEEERDIALRAEIAPARYVKDGKVQAMVQDEVRGANDPFTVLWFTDTQYYAESYPHIFDRLGDWIVEQYGQGAFQYAIHTGDLVNVANDEAQWAVADRNLRKLDEAGVPYGVLAGNHDVIIEGVDYSYYGKYVGADRYDDNPWYGGQMDNNRNHYDLFSFGGHDFVFLYIGFGLEDTPETIAWANEVLAKHADRIAVVGMHAYLETNGTLSNMAQSVFDQVIAPNKNVQLVLSGHYHAANRVVKTVQHEDGTSRQVIQMLADYQGGPNGGDGYVRLLRFDPVSQTLDVDTYSPYLDDYNFFEDGTDDFTEPFAFRDITKRVATDYFGVHVYRSDVIGRADGVASGSAASVVWPELAPETEYFWYMRITDEYGASLRSEVYRFTTEASADGGDGHNGGNDGNNGGGNDGNNGGGNDGNNGGGNDGNNSGGNDGNNGGGNDGNNSGGNDGNNSGGNDGNNGGGNNRNDTATVPPVAAGVIRANVKIDAGKAVVALGEANLSAAMNRAQADANGIKTIRIEADFGDVADWKNGIELSIPASYLAASSETYRLAFISPLGNVTLPSNMLDNDEWSEGSLSLSIVPSDPSAMPAEVRAGVGSRPMLDIELVKADGEVIEWSNDDASVEISIPYTPSAGERANRLVVWYIDEQGSIFPIVGGKFDATTQSMTFATTHFSRFAIAYRDVRFSDVTETAWHAEAIEYLAAREIVNGAGDGRFLPERAVTRAEFLVMAMNAFGIGADETAADNFADAGNQYYTPYLAAAKRLGLVNGLGDNRFAPEAGITRQDMAVMLYRISKAANVKLPSAENRGSLNGFSDAAEVADYATEAMNAFLRTGIVRGVGQGLLAPNGETSRAMAAQIIYNVVSK